ncbi:GcrA family cell cycle regulator [Brevundimonas sp. NPDC090276]|uniref:GcrA family cell cycle regulator n=1 Tax=Brevundimonas sp. NPDC090276 TaxID=3363956 RepID=UPI00383B6976
MSASIWTPERTERLVALWGEGRTAASIARLLGPHVSRCAVLGKVFRMGLVREASSVPPKPRAKLAVNDRASRVGRVARSGGRDGTLISGAAGPDPVPSSQGRRSVRPDVPEGPRATILSVKRGQCRWPYGWPGAAGFGLCGRPVARGAFCAAHAIVGYQGRGMSAERLIRIAELSVSPDQSGSVEV